MEDKLEGITQKRAQNDEDEKYKKIDLKVCRTK